MRQHNKMYNARAQRRAKFGVLVVLVATGVIEVAEILYLEIWIPIIQ